LHCIAATYDVNVYVRALHWHIGTLAGTTAPPSLSCDPSSIGSSVRKHCLYKRRLFCHALPFDTTKNNEINLPRQARDRH
jgi:hypothetical protein